MPLLTVRAVDGAGNLGPAAETRVAFFHMPQPRWKSAPVFAHEGGPLPRLRGGEVAILDELDKVQPVTGELIPTQAEGYLAANHLWQASQKQVTLHAARNEFVGFQILWKGSVGEATPSLAFDGEAGKKVKVEFGQYQHVRSAKGPLPDPIVGLNSREVVDGRQSSSIHVEVYVPHDIPSADLNGTLTIDAGGGEKLTLGVSLRVWDFTLPDSLSFLPEMNCYGLPSNERDFYRLAHKHRTFLNRLPYHQDGSIEPGCAPTWDGKKLDWVGLGPAVWPVARWLGLC